jgi:hypothetical protein
MPIEWNLTLREGIYSAPAAPSTPSGHLPQISKSSEFRNLGEDRVGAD